MEKKLKDILNSVNELSYLELNDKYSHEVNTGLNKAYEYIYSKKEEDMDEKDLLIINSMIRNFKLEGNLFYNNSIYRTNPVKVTSLPNPPHSSEIQKGMNQILYLTSDISELDSNNKALIAQGGIYGIQPFEDGNKRTGRCMADKILLEGEKRLLKFPSREKYLDALIETYKNIHDETMNGNLGNLDLYKPLKIGLQD